MKYLVLLTGLTGLLFQGCDAPRLNPLDPAAENYQLQSETIQLRRLSNPALPVPSVRVLAPEIGLSGLSDANGDVRFSHGRIASYAVRTESDLYFDNGATIKGGAFNDPLLLNARPVIHSRIVHSIYNNTNKSTEYLARLEVNDPDGLTDIRAVELQIAENAYRDTLRVLDGMKGLFITNKNITEIDAGMTAGELPEKHFFFTVFNQNGDSVQTDASTITRVIVQDIYFTEPAPQSTLSGDITFRWNDFSLDYPFSFELEIFAIVDNSFQLIKKYEAIPSVQREMTVSDGQVLALLSPLNNFARVSIVDNSQNICYSVPLFFTYSP